MIKAATMLCAGLALSAALVTTSGSAFARGPGEIGCVDGYPAPPFTNSCPSGPSRAFAAADKDRDLSCAQRYRSFDPASGTYRGRDGQRHVCQ